MFSVLAANMAAHNASVEDTLAGIAGYDSFEHAYHNASRSTLSGIIETATFFEKECIMEEGTGLLKLVGGAIGVGVIALIVAAADKANEPQRVYIPYPVLPETRQQGGRQPVASKTRYLIESRGRYLVHNGTWTKDFRSAQQFSSPAKANEEIRRMGLHAQAIRV
jgi:hypothetical protein